MCFEQLTSRGLWASSHYWNTERSFVVCENSRGQTWRCTLSHVSSHTTDSTGGHKNWKQLQPWSRWGSSSCFLALVNVSPPPCLTLPIITSVKTVVSAWQKWSWGAGHINMVEDEWGWAGDSKKRKWILYEVICVWIYFRTIPLIFPFKCYRVKQSLKKLLYSTSHSTSHLIVYIQYSTFQQKNPQFFSDASQFYNNLEYCTTFNLIMINLYVI